MTDNGDNILNFEDIRAIEQEFLKWQCRIRQHAVRENGGRPEEGMQPWVTLADHEEPVTRIITLLIKKQPQDDNARLQFINKKTIDPQERYKKGLEHLQEWFYQYPDEFSDRLTALFGPESELAARLRQDRQCILHFADRHRKYRFPCKVTALKPEDPAFEATYWHNALFNPEMPAGVQVLAFDPYWNRVEADPDPSAARG
ncbi:hypothetical protein [Thiohalorhabdus methylotrophus]|uniref:Uncharacterized protein n=1 Tax=Thiohalorhabdus methylotrophus TaxID=3242694 RepID=A0ABV4TV67_9GAMM